MKIAVTIIAICEVIRTIQIALDMIIGTLARRATLASINKVGDGVADELTPENMAKAIVKIVEEKAEVEE